MNYYETLEIARNASPSVIKAAYKALSQKYHPDKNHGDKQYDEKIAVINVAFDVLSNPVTRQAYDQHLDQHLDQTLEQLDHPEQDAIDSKKYKYFKSLNGFHLLIASLVASTLFLIINNKMRDNDIYYDIAQIKLHEPTTEDTQNETALIFAKQLQASKELNKEDGLTKQDVLNLDNQLITPAETIDFTDLCKNANNEYVSCSDDHVLSEFKSPLPAF